MGQKTVMSYGCIAARKHMQRFCFESRSWKWVSNEYKVSKSNFIFLDLTNNNLISLLKILSFENIKEKGYLIDEIKSSASLAYNREHELHWPSLEFGDLQQNNKWLKTLVIENSYFKDCKR